ncbi:hypothetical protein [Actinokineospora cianjurensis]|uniref:Uncharacterized protein n=1 Tax=Actinokineospora cianjurensis TaxID=585224 RepID=A0A421B3A0_9PSEU|nr:hypothetical protein [Actinokineospora cianjurensis]RLK58906.1 hypothetical protein CLV68_3387 [Actinokineospora cianjurensis]
MSETSVRNRQWILPAAVAVVLVAAVVVGRRRPGGYVVLGWLDQPVLFGTIAIAMVAFVCWLVVDHNAWRPFLIGAFSALALCWAAFGALVGSMTVAPVEQSRHASPNGEREVIISRGYTGMTPSWQLRVTTGAWPTARSWDLGCVNSDTATLNGVRWTGADTVRVLISRPDDIDITLDPTTARPTTPLTLGC